MSENRILGLEQLSSSMQEAVLWIQSVALEPNTGAHVILENRFIDWNSTSHPTEAFYVSRRVFSRFGPEQGTPNGVLDHLEDENWSHFIWISREIVQSTPEKLFLRLSHEIRHYQQELDSSLTSSKRKFINWRKNQGFKPSIRAEDDAEECDADLYSVECFIRYYGVESFQQLIKDEENPNIKSHLEKIFEMYRIWAEYRET